MNLNIFDVIVGAFYLLTAGIFGWMIFNKKKVDGAWLSVLSVGLTIIVIDLVIMGIGFDPYALKIRKVYDEEMGVKNLPGLAMQVQFDAAKNGDLLDVYGIDPQSLPTLPTQETYDFPYQIDQNGFRNRLGMDLKQVKIVSVGDSYTIASSLPQELAWPALVAKSMSVPGYNAAVNQIGPENYLKILKFLAPKLTPKTTVLIAFFEGNDLGSLSFEVENRTKKNLATFLQYFYEQLMSPKKVRISLSLPEFSIHGQKYPLLFLKPYVDGLLRTSEDIQHDKNLLALEEIFSLMSEVCTQYDLNCTLVYFPEKFHVYYPLLGSQFGYGKYFETLLPGTPVDDLDPQTMEANIGNLETVVRSLAEKSGLKFISLTSALQKEAKDFLLFFPYDTHLNGLGNEISAQEIVKQLGQ